MCITNVGCLNHRMDIYDVRDSCARLDEIDSAFHRLRHRHNDRSLLKKCLTEEIFEVVRARTTSSNASLLDVIRSGVTNSDSTIGIYAPDAESYEVFAALFDEVIEEYHQIRAGSASIVPQPIGARSFANPDKNGKHIISTRIRCARSLARFPFNPRLDRCSYMEIETLVQSVLETLSGELKGRYHPLTALLRDEKKRSDVERIMFDNHDRFLEAAGAYRFWPSGRGIFFNEDRSLIVWVNEEDHLRIMSMQPGADLAATYARFQRAMQLLGSQLDFAHDGNRGYLNSCPTNVGTALRASVHIRLPKLEKKRQHLQCIAQRHYLQIRGTNGEHSGIKGAVFDISNARRLGITENEAIADLQAGLTEIIDAEESL